MIHCVLLVISLYSQIGLKCCNLMFADFFFEFCCLILAPHRIPFHCISRVIYLHVTHYHQAIGEQFRRKGNVYFLVMGCMMALGYYTEYFDSSISPWTTLGPLALVIGISIAQEGVSDIARHRSDDQSNKHPCTVLSLEGQTPHSTPFLTSLSSKENSKNSKNNSKDTAVDFTKSVKILPSGTKEEARVNIDFHTVKRCDLRVGQLILIKNREMIPCDLVLLASSNENGGAYIETSGIDGETNLKLRNSAKPLKPLASSEKMPIASTALSGRRKYFQGFTTTKVEELPDENVESPEKGQKLVSPSKSFDDSKISFDGEGKSLHKRSSSMPISAPISPSTKTDGQVDKKEQKVSKSDLPSKSRFDTTESKFETLEEATARLAQCTALGFPNGKQATCLTDVPLPPPVATTPSVLPSPGILRHIRNVSFDQFESVRSVLGNVFNTPNSNIRNSIIASHSGGENYVAVVTCELPNASVHTFNGKLTLPPTVGDERHTPMEVSLSAENFLLRGAFLRNTEWAIGVACFTGPDTKLVKNSSAAPSRMSQLDQLV
jgi:magnesium-transporting ATPase (P-type)